jgi:gamma-glutamyltranspeptidase/glutathione hydrolase
MHYTNCQQAPVRAILLAVPVALILVAPPCAQGQDSRPAKVEARHGMVVSVSPPASDVGLTILKRGGSAVDAAVATALALAVSWPEAGNIGGGGFMLVWPGGGQEPVCIDYRETAPAEATRDMFSHDRERYTHKTVGVPGTLRGLALAHTRWGKLRWAELVAPAAALAEEGFAIDQAMAEELNDAIVKLNTSAEFRRVFAPPQAATWRAGDRLVQPQLARTLRLIAEHGPDAFYSGEIARAIVAEMRAGGGLITADDLAGYQAIIRPPVHGTYRGFDIYGPPPPSSGGTCVVEMLNILENFELAPASRWSPRTCHLMIEAMRRAYCDRARYLGDPEFVEIPAHLTSKEYARKLATHIDPVRATESTLLAPDVPLVTEAESTTHFSIVDSDGMAVANTYTLQEAFGSRIVVRGAGFVLNNEMTDFNARPGHTDRKGAIGTAANVVAPGKRMLSSQSPTIVARDGRLMLVTGSPGGRTISNTVLCVVVNTLDFGMDVRAAVDAPRMHNGWLPDRVLFESSDEAQYAPLARALAAMGHHVVAKPREQGDAHTIRVIGQTLEGAADLRQTAGKAAGY